MFFSLVMSLGIFAPAQADTVVANITSPGIQPTMSVFTPDGNSAFVLHASGVSKLDLSSNTFVGSTISVGSGPFDMVISSDGSHLFVSNEVDNSITVINTANQTTATFTFTGGNSPPSGLFSPRSLYLSPDNTRLYVSNSAGNFLASLNVSTPMSPTTRPFIDMGMETWAMTGSRDGSTLYVSKRGANEIKTVNTTTNAVAAWATVVSETSYLSVSPNGSGIFATTTSLGTITKFSTAGSQVAQYSLGGAPGPIGFSANSSKVYITSTLGGGELITADAANFSVLSSISVGSGPSAVQLNQNGTVALVIRTNSDVITRVNIDIPVIPTPAPEPSPELATTGQPVEYTAVLLLASTALLSGLVIVGKFAVVRIRNK